jgi:hypothetical protein
MLHVVVFEGKAVKAEVLIPRSPSKAGDFLVK